MSSLFINVFLYFRLSMVDLGSLMISEVQASDAGKFECTAQSMAGTKTAPAAMLKVLAPPKIVRGPQDTEVVEGEGLDLPCDVSGHLIDFIRIRMFLKRIKTYLTQMLLKRKKKKPFQ